ncbi:MAG TPA: dephospho-CoA kinase, partial [Negativicutes bacterium]
MYIIGLTGGIASGKSTVSAMLAELGACIVDADKIARDIVAPKQPA